VNGTAEHGKVDTQRNNEHFDRHSFQGKQKKMSPVNLLLIRMKLQVKLQKEFGAFKVVTINVFGNFKKASISGYEQDGLDLISAGQDFSLLHSVQTNSVANSASYLMGTGGDSPGGKAAGA
jgi:hypothetical protein